MGKIINFVRHLNRDSHLTEVAIRKHDQNVRELRCVITRSPFVTMHHCHGGSMKDAGWHVGMGQKQNPFLQIPLREDYHVGDMGIDRIGVLTWENLYGTQMEHLMWVNDQLPYDIWRLASRWEEEHRGRNPQSTATRKSNGRG